ncbi:OX26 protein, partial [Bucco capensis]|nr:OX26 protein [Bucco capensis]
MRAPYSLSCLFLLSLGTCFPRRERQELGQPGARASSRHAVAEAWGAGGKPRRSEELSVLLGIPRELAGSGQQRLGRQRGSELRGSELRGSELRGSAGEKRSGALGSLAEELNGYNRRRGGFTFRFGR